MKKRFLAVFLALALCVGLMPTVFASADYLDDGREITFQIDGGTTGRISIDAYVRESGYYTFTVVPSLPKNVDICIYELHPVFGYEEVINELECYTLNRVPEFDSCVWLEADTYYDFGLKSYDGIPEGKYTISTKFWGDVSPLYEFRSAQSTLHIHSYGEKEANVYIQNAKPYDAVCEWSSENCWGMYTVWSGDIVKFKVEAFPGYEYQGVDVEDKKFNFYTVRLSEWEDPTCIEGDFLMPSATAMLNISLRHSFTDLKPDAYYLDAVKWAVTMAITNGKTETTFAPDETCTHGQILTFLWRAAGEPESSAQPPIALKGDEFYYKAVKWAAEKGMIGADFNPSAPCTRADAVSYIWQAFGKTTASYDGRFTDVPASAPYAPAVAWALARGVTTGTSATTFSPDKICNRGEIVTFLYRAYK